MLIVRIYVNSEHIGTVTARRIKGDASADSVGTYIINEGTKKIRHRYGDGAAKLAQKMLNYAEVQPVLGMGFKSA